MLNKPKNNFSMAKKPVKNTMKPLKMDRPKTTEPKKTKYDNDDYDNLFNDDELNFEEEAPAKPKSKPAQK